MAFWFFLSTRFGKTVAELKATMPYAEFVHHVAYHKLCPWGDDWRQTQALHATIMSASTKFRTFNLDKYFPQRRSSGNLQGLFDAMKDEAEKQSRGNVR